MKTRKVVINKCFGGFSISKKAVKMLAEMEGRKCYFFKPRRKIPKPVNKRLIFGGH